MTNKLLPAAVSTLAVAFTALSIAAGTASATPPDGNAFTFSETFVDDGASAACGFDVVSSTTTTGHFRVFVDSSGTPSRVQIEENTSGTFSANGLSVDQTGHVNTTFDLVTGSETDVGITIKVSLPDGGVLYSDRGRLIFDSTPSVTFESGHHPSLHGDFPGLCAALTP